MKWAAIFLMCALPAVPAAAQDAVVEISEEALNRIVFPVYFGEFLVVLWLAFVGAKPRTAEA